MAKLLKPPEEAKKAITARILAGKDLTAKAAIAERTGGYKDWLVIFAKWREETAAKLTTHYEERDIGQEFTAVTMSGEYSSPRFTFPYRKRALELGLFWLESLIGRLELAVWEDSETDGMARDFPREVLIKVGNLKGMLVSRATGGTPDEQAYAKLRAELLAMPPIRDALPTFVLTCSTIREFWNFIKDMFETDKYRQRTAYLQQEFLPILSWLEGHGPPNGAESPSVSGARRATKMIKVLLLSANPVDAPLSIEEEFRAIDAKIRASEHRDHVQLILHGAVRLDDIPGLLMRHKPHVVHFSGHGAASGIALTGPDGAARLVPPDALAHIFRALKDNVRVVLLNACDSALQAEAIVSEIDCAVGMSDEIEDQAAIAFAAAFYEALGYGRSVQTAFDLALVQLAGAGADRSLAKLHKRRGVKPTDIILVNPQRPQ